MESEADTELLLVLLQSSLPPTVEANQVQLLDALVASDGDVERAVHIILRRPIATSSKAKKKRSSLDNWLSPSSSSGGPSKKRRVFSSTHKPPKDYTPSTSVVPSVDVSETGRTLLPLSSILKDPSTSLKGKGPLRPSSLKPLMLLRPEDIAAYTPTTLHTSVLPADLACRLYYAMLDEAKHWKKNKWFIADRLVESPHTTSFYVRGQGLKEQDGHEEMATTWYNGRSDRPASRFLPVMEEALTHVEKIVQEQMTRRKQYHLEWNGPWKANVAAANCYRGSSQGVGSHADGLTYIGPYPTIASISLGTTRNFRLREVIPVSEANERQARTYDIPLPHNSLLIMHPPTQELFKHSIPTVKCVDAFRPSIPRSTGEAIEAHTERINITFRFYRPDYHPDQTPRCLCNAKDGKKISAILKANQKRRGADEEPTFFWMCNSGAQNEKEGCKMWRPLEAV